MKNIYKLCISLLFTFSAFGIGGIGGYSGGSSQAWEEILTNDDYDVAIPKVSYQNNNYSIFELCSLDDDYFYHLKSNKIIPKTVEITEEDEDEDQYTYMRTYSRDYEVEVYDNDDEYDDFTPLFTKKFRIKKCGELGYQLI